jgi:hypothetical protein
MLRKMIVVSALAGALNALLIPSGFAFSGGASHVVTHPVVMSRGASTAMAQAATAIHVRNTATQHPRPSSRAR